ncbi:hypothetical protein B0H34DRAFT_736563 [Crassisporium funariophilum]|nr:hypothetical protein B0H34DRAFT_736563 [Crassisporium funariophilum]
MLAPQWRTAVLLISLAGFPLADATFQPLGVPFKAPVTVAPGFGAHVLFSNLTTPRGIVFDSLQNLLVVERGFGVTAFTPINTPDGAGGGSGWSRTVVVQNVGLTQGIMVDGKALFVSTAGEVLVYLYDPRTKSINTNIPAYSVVTGIPADGELTTHTLQLEKESGNTVALLVASGPKTNIDETARDPASGRSQIRRFVLPKNVLPTPSPPPPLQWANGQVIAYGIRNPAGFAFLPTSPSMGPSPAKVKSLLVVENGASIDNVTGLTPLFVNDNPADELELVTYSTANSVHVVPKSYGFPDCTTLWNPRADPVGNPQFLDRQRGDQFSLNLEPSRGDSWCQNKANNEPPVLSFQAHSVPLDVKLYQTPLIPAACATAFPVSFNGHAFISFHGSFDRSPPTGYGVVRVPYPIETHDPLGDALGYSFMIQAANLTTCPGSCIRPVGLAFGNDGRLYVSSDSSGELFVIERI